MFEFELGVFLGGLGRLKGAALGLALAAAVRRPPPSHPSPACAPAPLLNPSLTYSPPPQVTAQPKKKE